MTHRATRKPIRATSVLCAVIAWGMTLGLACDKNEAGESEKPAATSAEPQAGPGEAKAVADTTPDAAAPSEQAGACKLAPVFADGCPLSAADAQVLLGTTQDLTLNTENPDGACRVMQGPQRVLLVKSAAVTPKVRDKRLKDFTTQVDLGFSERVELGLGDCPAIFRGSSYNHLHVAGAETFVEIQVGFPAIEADGPDGKKAASDKRLDVAKKVAAKLFADVN